MSTTAIPYQLYSQATCNGIWGKPIVNITFGAGTNPGGALTAATSVYKYIETDCPDDGYYTIRNNSAGCFYDDWHSIINDHTGDSSGYFLLMNTSFLPNNFYLDTIQNLCSSTTYQFGAWILNLIKPTSCGGITVKPNINFRVEKTNGELLASFNTNDIESSASAVWKRYAFIFSTNETSIVLRMTNINPGGCGGDFAIDDITLTPCVADVNIHLETKINIAQSLVYQCKSKDTTFTFKSDFNNIYNEVGYLWESSIDSGKNWINIAGSNQSSYTHFFPSNNKESLNLFRLSVGEIANIGSPKCLVQANIDSVLTISEPLVVSSSNSPLCENASLIMNSRGGSQYSWKGPNEFLATGNKVSLVKLKTLNSGKYYVNVSSQFGCSTLDSLEILVRNNPKSFAGNDTSICEGSSLRLKGSGGIKYLWWPASSLTNATIPNPYATPVDTTVYMLKVIDQFDCIDSSIVSVNVLKKPLVNAGADVTILNGDSVQLQGKVTGTGINYYWTPDMYIRGFSKLKPFVSPITNITYTLHANSKYGCGSSTDEINIKVITHPQIPNVFSPNNDGINDTWLIKDLDNYSLSDVSVFNRYGQKVFASHGFNISWDGRFNGNNLPIGTYYYLIHLKSRNIILNGSVTILK